MNSYKAQYLCGCGKESYRKELKQKNGKLFCSCNKEVTAEKITTKEKSLIVGVLYPQKGKK